MTPLESVVKVRDFFLSLPANIFDIVFFLLFFFYVLEEGSNGILSAVLHFITVVLSFLIGITFYSYVAGVLSGTFSLSKGLADALSFLLVASLSWIIIKILFSLFYKVLPPLFLDRRVDFLGGAFFGVLSYLFFASFFFSLLLSFPIAKGVKEKLVNSSAAGFLIARTSVIETNVKQVFGGAIEETLNFLTIKPESEETVYLHFKAQDLSVDKNAEQAMLMLINQEREKRGLSRLVFDEELAEVARTYAFDMLERQYFSHYSLEGYSPFDRLEAAGISYIAAGENLALAPDTRIAMQGLMKSKGHRENILSSLYHNVGIGVVDAGVYGKMFVQEFTD